MENNPTEACADCGEGAPVKTEAQKAPLPGLEWHLTDVCNYRCEYCSERQFDPDRPHTGMTPDDLVLQVLAVTADLPGKWLVKFSHGEPTLHPRFPEICQRLAEQGHDLALTTNFSMSPEKIRRFLEACGDHLKFVTASLHLSQTKLDRFIERALLFQAEKPAMTEFIVSMVVTPENFREVKTAFQILVDAGLEPRLQLMKTRRGLAVYDTEVEEFMKGKTIGGAGEIRGRNFRGRLCHTGELFFIIKPNGDCLRCFSQPPAWNYLGSIRRGSFRRYSGPRPCLSDYCNCPVAKNRRMIEHGSGSSRAERALHALRAAARGWRYAAFVRGRQLRDMLVKKGNSQ